MSETLFFGVLPGESLPGRDGAVGVLEVAPHASEVLCLLLTTPAGDQPVGQPAGTPPQSGSSASTTHGVAPQFKLPPGGAQGEQTLPGQETGDQIRPRTRIAARLVHPWYERLLFPSIINS